MEINYYFTNTRFGKVIVGVTHKGLRHLSFCSSKNEGLDRLQKAFPKAQLVPAITDPAISDVISGQNPLSNLKLDLKGTSFQVKVWQALAEIPCGQLRNYADIARAIGMPKAVRAVGTAVGLNPIAILIPCHRVIRSNGQYGKYRWGEERKQALIAWEKNGT